VAVASGATCAASANAMLAAEGLSGNRAERDERKGQEWVHQIANCSGRKRARENQE
jgi:hypothetical protein